MRSRGLIALLIVLISACSAYAQRQFTDYSKVTRLRWMGPGKPGTYAEYLAARPPQPLKIVPVRLTSASLRAELPRVLIIANNALLPLIQANVDRYISDIEAQGYAVDLYSSTFSTAENLKAFIISQSTNLAGCVLFGSLPCAWFEVPDDYFEYGYGEFPCDLYLMDLDGAWSDLETVSPMQSGVYDSHLAGSGDVSPEIFVGRIDASRMSGEAEYVQINSYLDKLHAWYSGELQVTNYALTYTDEDWVPFSDFQTDIALAYPSNEAITFPYVNSLDYAENRLTSLVYQFIQLSCHSSSTIHYFSLGDELLSSGIKAIPPRALFYNLFCCSALRFTDANCLGGSYIFNSSATSLATVGSTKTGSMLEFWAFYEPLGEGKTLGQAFSDWFNTLAPYSIDEIFWYYGMTIIGDPLIVPVSSDPSSIVLMRPNGGEILAPGEECEIQWALLSAPPDSISILLSADGGNTYPYTVAHGLPGSNTTFLWTVPTMPPFARIKVLAWYGGVVGDYDCSDSDIIIQSGHYRYASTTGDNIFPYCVPAWAALNIQDAIDAASPGDSILVAGGSYYENISVAEPIYILGGWNSDFTIRDAASYESRIQRAAGPSVSFISVASGVCGVEGMTLANGIGSPMASPVTGIFGGGVFSYYSSPRIKDNVFFNCGAAEVTSFSGGGAIACYGGDAVIDGNEIAACKAQSGGGIYVYGGSAAIRNNVISDCYANAEYTGDRRGGGVFAYGADVELEGNAIRGNRNYKAGGGIWSFSSRMSMKGDSVYANAVSGSGGGIYAEGDSIEIFGVVATGNTASSFGGGVYAKSAHVDMTNSIIALNSAMIGGGLVSDGVSGTIVNNTVDRNRATVVGGNMYLVNPGVLDVRGNIISYGKQGGILVPSPGGMSLAYNNAYGNTLGDYSGIVPDTTNISRDPRYADTTSFDYHLLVHSGSIDASDPAPVYFDPDGSRGDQGAFGGPAAVMAAPEYVKDASAVVMDVARIRVTWDGIEKTFIGRLLCGVWRHGGGIRSGRGADARRVRRERSNSIICPPRVAGSYVISAVYANGYAGGYGAGRGVLRSRDGREGAGDQLRRSIRAKLPESLQRDDDDCLLGCRNVQSRHTDLRWSRAYRQGAGAENETARPLRSGLAGR